MGISLPQIRTSSERLSGAASLAPPRRNAWLGIAHTIFFCSSRLAFAAFLLLTSVYCLLVFVPFSYFGFIQNPLLKWLPVFVQLHGLIYGVLLTGVAVTLIPDLRRKATRRAAMGFLVLNGSVFVSLWRGNALAGLRPDLSSYLWSMLSLFPLVWLAALDLSGKENWPPEQREGLDLPRTTLAAVIISLAFAATSVLRGTLRGGDLPLRLGLQGFAASLCFHLAIFTGFGLVLGLIGLATSRTPWPGVFSFALKRAFVWLLLFQGLRTMILPTISFEGLQANTFAAVVSLAVVLSATGFTARLRALDTKQRLQIAQTMPPAWLWVLAAFGLLAAAYAIPVMIGPTDWDFVLQKLAVMIVWISVLQLVCWIGFGKTRRAASVATLLVLTAAAAGFARYARLALYNPDPSPAWQGMLDSYSGADISFKAAYDVLSRRMDDHTYRPFYEFLKQHTNLGRDVTPPPVDLRLVSDLQPTPGIKPNIFIFVIDSLRQDSVSPYNPAVDYMPEINRFAQDSVVMEHAYTRYGGTGLSVPAIWTGTMQLHKQFIEPFYPMNNLEKLMETDGYQSYVSIDPILRMMLRPSPSITPLDKDIKFWGDLDFVPTVKELEAKIDSRPDRTKPIFAYTQPQNVHTLTTEPSQIKGNRKEVTIYELRRIDAAFGEFVGFLRQRGLYDNSIIIITADHGDCYGEFGRFGHSDFLFPQVIRIPLIIHLPPRMRDHFVWDTHQLAFSTDITPSLYYLLGHQPILNNELFGRPLFTHTLQEQSAYMRPQYLIVASYAPVYAILGGRDQSLFIVDAVNSKNYYYNLIEDPTGAHNQVTIKLRNENEVLIRRGVGLIDDLYHWHPEDGGQ